MTQTPTATVVDEPAGENVIEINPPLAKLEAEALSLYEKVLLLPVVDQASHDAMALIGSGLKSLGFKIQEHYKPLKQEADEAKQKILDEEKKYLTPVKEAMQAAKDAMQKWLVAEEKKRIEQQRALQAEQEKRAEQERQKLLKQAATAEAKGDVDKAEEKKELAEAVYAAPVVIAPTVKMSTANSNTVGELKVTVTDPVAFLAELVRRKMAPTMIEIKAGPLKSWVKANDFADFPGLAIEKTLAVRLKK